MWDIIMAHFGKNHCPWCKIHDPEHFGPWERFTNHWPLWFVSFLTPYDEWVGRVGGGYHRKNHL